MIDIRQLLIEGHAARAKEHSEKEKQIGAAYRIGSCGVVTEAGEVHGTCHRIAHVRDIGLEKRPAPESPMRIMWLAGEYNEDATFELLSKSSYPGKIGTHDDLGVDVLIDELEQKLVGHPDIGLFTKDDKVEMALELKGVFGKTTAISVYLEDTPKNDNLCQAAMYSAKLDVPYALMYTNPSYVSLDYWAKKQYGISSIPPFYKIFYLRWTKDTLEYRPESQVNWITTSITKTGLDDYYRLLDEMKTKKDLGPRLNSHYVHGKDHKWGQLSDCKFCDYAEACNKYEAHNNYDQWIEGVKDAKKEEDV